MSQQISVARGWSNPCIAPKLARGRASVTLHHVMSPCCWWSWGYLGALARIRLVYGDQVDLNLAWAVPYTDVDRYYEHGGFTDDGFRAWARESQETMGVPIFTSHARASLPKDLTPALLATVAALRQGRPLGERFARALLRRNVVEGLDVTRPEAVRAAALEAKLDLARFEADLQDHKGLQADLAAQEQTLPHLPLGFYNLVLEDAAGRKVVLDHSFDPKPIEEAIEWLSGGTLVRNQPDDPVVFLQATGAAPTVELSRAFGWPVEEAEARLRALEKQRRVKRVEVGGAAHWDAA